MSIEFSQIPARLKYPRNLQGKLSSLHSDVITYVSSIYDGSHGLRSKTIRLMNTITRHLVDGDTFPVNWSSSRPFDNIDIEDELSLKENLNELYINPKEINWDIAVAVNPDTNSESNTSTKLALTQKQASSQNKVKTIQETDKSDLYIQPPTVPQFDVSKVWVSAVIDGTLYCIYNSIPIVPTKQNEISITTDVNMMSDSQLMNLFPHNFIRTRSPSMYEPLDRFNYHPQLGLVLPIKGYTQEQLIDNIIKYPHLFKLSKIKDGEPVSFYNTIEIDGALQKVSDVWNEFEDTSLIPYTADFVKEYVVRRYLLERDVKGIEHKFPMYGDLNPFLTLFTTCSDYINWGYKDVIELARQCVNSRVSYKRSRNPILRRCGNV